MRTSFHHQPEAQHPKSPAIKTPAGRLPHLSANNGLMHSNMIGAKGKTASAAVLSEIRSGVLIGL
jgi:hypothetical protein